MTDRLAGWRDRVAPGGQTFHPHEERTMRWLELALALTAIGAAALLAIAR